MPYFDAQLSKEFRGTKGEFHGMTAQNYFVFLRIFFYGLLVHDAEIAEALH